MPRASSAFCVVDSPVGLGGATSKPPAGAGGRGGTGGDGPGGGMARATAGRGGAAAAVGAGDWSPGWGRRTGWAGERIKSHWRDGSPSPFRQTLI